MPICDHDAKKSLGALKPAQVLTDHIATEAGFSKHSYQAQCESLESDGATRRSVHVKKQSPWFVAAVAGPKLGATGEMPTVTVIDDLAAKVLGGDLKDPETAVAAADTEPEDWQNEEFDPMAELDDIVQNLETPKKKNTCKQGPLRSVVREIAMPKRPPCVQCDTGVSKSMQFY